MNIHVEPNLENQLLTELEAAVTGELLSIPALHKLCDSFLELVYCEYSAERT